MDNDFVFVRIFITWRIRNIAKLRSSPLFLRWIEFECINEEFLFLKHVVNIFCEVFWFNLGHTSSFHFC